MVGHTGDIKATIEACKAADDGVKVIALPWINCSEGQKFFRPCQYSLDELQDLDELISMMLFFFTNMLFILPR